MTHTKNNNIKVLYKISFHQGTHLWVCLSNEENKMIIGGQRCIHKTIQLIGIDT